jgi:peptidoglycan/LPS O-acetylase OafA/YrhL
MAGLLSYDAYQARHRFPALDGLRALAIFGVLLHHTRHHPFALFHGYRGVWVFFVLSGFLITTLALRQEAQLGRLDLRGFALRRIFRIMPLYYLVLGVNFLATLVFGLESYRERLQQHALAFVLYSSEFPIISSDFHLPFGQSWSLGIEEKFYLVWPLLAFWLLGRSKFRIPMTLVLIGTAATLTATAGTFAQIWGSYTDILLGCLLAQLLHERAIYGKVAFLGRTEVAWGLVIALGLATVSAGSGTQIGERVYSVLAAAVLIGLVTAERGPVRLLTAGWLIRIGTWSYAIYLTHTIFFDIAGKVLPPGRIGDVLTLPAALLVDIPLCWLLHIYVEKPLMALGRRLSTRTQAKSTRRAVGEEPLPSRSTRPDEAARPSDASPASAAAP